MHNKCIMRYIRTYFLVIMLFILIMIAGCLFPSTWIEENVKQSAEMLEKEGRWREFGFSIIDNVADPLMINEAYSVDYRNPIFSAFAVRKNYKEGLTKEQLKDLRGELITFQVPKDKMELIEINGVLYSKDTRTNYAVLTQNELNDSPPEVIELDGETFYTTEYNTCKELKKFADGEVETSVEYARYWHGYLPFLRILLLFFNVSEIRILFIVIFIMLLIYMMILLKKEFGLSIAIIFASALIWHDYLMVGYSLQCSPLFFVMMITTIIFIKKKEKKKSFDAYLYFFIVGMLTSFVDYLTCPLISLGVLLTIELLYFKKESKSLKDSILLIIKASILWGIGYGITWLSKWIIYDVLYDGEILKVGMTQFFYRAQRSNYKIKGLRLLDIFLTLLMWGALGIMVLILIVFPNIEGFKLKNIKKIIINNLPFMIISIIPLVWHTILKNHTLLHWNFSFRDFVLIQISVLIILNDIVTYKKPKKCDG